MVDSTVLIQPKRELLFGSSAGVSDLAILTRSMLDSKRPEILVNIDFTGVKAVNGSYLRATLLWAIKCGQADVKGELPGASNDILPVRPYPLFPVVTGCSPEVSLELAEFVFPRGISALLLKEGHPPAIGKASVMGNLDQFLWGTLSLLSAAGGGTAQQLADRSKEKISVNGWSNRLIDLYMLRLVHRERSGKFWIYKPIAKEYDIWASIS